jgi:hypothetical protein
MSDLLGYLFREAVRNDAILPTQLSFLEEFLAFGRQHLKEKVAYFDIAEGHPQLVMRDGTRVPIMITGDEMPTTAPGEVYTVLGSITPNIPAANDISITGRKEKWTP